MNLKELDNFRLADAVKFHTDLNPVLFNDSRMRSEIKKQLLLIAEDFIDHLGIDDIDVKDITLSGSNAAYTYTDHSDIDIHLLVDISDLKNNDIYRELFNSKKIIYNDTHDIKIKGYDVELYVQDTAEPVKSLGEYSILNDRWIKFPGRVKSNIDERSASEKYIKLYELSKLALKTSDLNLIDNLLATIKKYRRAGLSVGGEFSSENIAYKAIRTRGIIDKLYQHRDMLHSKELSVIESASGYIPSKSQKNDPRYKTALTVDINSDSIRTNAKKLGLGNIKRSGIPPTLKFGK